MEKVIEGDYPCTVMHEAIEALGNFNSFDSIALMRRFEKKGSTYSNYVRETVELMRGLLNWNKETNKG